MGIVVTRNARLRRHHRVRAKVSGSMDNPRLCVFRSARHIYAQIIDDTAGHTMVSASSLDEDVKNQGSAKTKISQAGLVGKLIAERALAKSIRQVVFDRGGYKYHGRVMSLANAAREAGLKF